MIWWQPAVPTIQHSPAHKFSWKVCPETTPTKAVCFGDWLAIVGKVTQIVITFIFEVFDRIAWGFGRVQLQGGEECSASCEPFHCAKTS